MAGHAAAGRHDRLGRDHAVKVVGTRLNAYQHDPGAFLGHFVGFIGAEHDLALGRAGARREAGRQHLRVGFGIDGRMQQLIELLGSDALDRGGAID